MSIKKIPMINQEATLATYAEINKKARKSSMFIIFEKKYDFLSYAASGRIWILLTYLLHGAVSFLRSQPVFS